MKVSVGVDLGSTTSKAIVLDEDGRILGRGITNSRSNYDVAVEIARTEAFIQARFALLRGRVAEVLNEAALADKFTAALNGEFRLEQYLHQLGHLERAIAKNLDEDTRHDDVDRVRAWVEQILTDMRGNARSHFRFAAPLSTFFRDIATSDYMTAAQKLAEGQGGAFDRLANLFDKSIIIVENKGLDLSFGTNISEPFDRVIERFGKQTAGHADALRAALKTTVDEDLEVAANVGTGYGRARLPFKKEDIRSEILCHGLGAHRMFPATRTVLDIGGQDTKAIQVDGDGIVTSFQMNDRCAAGCGRYLGYIADEMNLGVHELGPIADQSCQPVRINSTCTVFAGAELRDRLTVGQKREDILAGLHRAIILRAMSLLARSGGIDDEFTFTGGVANNTAAVHALKDLVTENYGDRTVNISSDSIFTGALGAATFAHRSVYGKEAVAP